MIIIEGDIVARISYGKDIIFVVDKIYGTTAILKGLTIRISADAEIDDLEHVREEQIETNVRSLDEKIEEIVRKSKLEVLKRKIAGKELMYTGKILHLDGDRRYSDKSVKYYRQLGLNAVVKNIPEYKQAYFVRELLERYRPDILVITRT